MSRQVELLGSQTAAVERQVEVALQALSVHDRPVLDPGSLSFTQPRRLTMQVTNRGQGAGWITGVALVLGPDATGLLTGMQRVRDAAPDTVKVRVNPSVIGVDEQSVVLGAPMDDCAFPAVVWIVIAVRDITAAESWTYFFPYQVRAEDHLLSGVAVSATFATRGKAVDKGTINWPLDALRRASEADSVSEDDRQ